MRLCDIGMFLAIYLMYSKSDTSQILFVMCIIFYFLLAFGEFMMRKYKICSTCGKDRETDR